MANTTHPAPAPNPPAHTDHPAGAAPSAPYSAYPGGMASDPIAQLASEISTNIKGLPDRMRSLIDSTPAFRNVMDQVENDMVASIAQSIRRVVETEVAKVTGGYSLTSEKDKEKLATEKKIP